MAAPPVPPLVGPPPALPLTSLDAPAPPPLVDLPFLDGSAPFPVGNFLIPVPPPQLVLGVGLAGALGTFLAITFFPL